MPIINEISYINNNDVDEQLSFEQQQSVISGKLFPEDVYRRDSSKKKHKYLRKMFQHDNSFIRPRKIQGGGNTWTDSRQTRSDKNSTQLFCINDVYYSNTVTAENGRNLKTDKKAEQSLCKKILKFFDSYCEQSSLHGLHYVGDTRLSISERLFWLLAFLSALAFASYYISNIYVKWTKNPVIVSFSPTDATVDDIPFPSITICNMNQAKRSEADRILKEGSPAEKHLLYDYCSTNNTFNGSSKDAPRWKTVQDFLVKVGQPCSEMLKGCYWKSDPINCEEYFNNELTDEGLCCSFNRLPPTLIFRNLKDLAVLNQTYPGNVYDWTPETGFPKNDTFDEASIPRRPSGAGSHLGLTIIADTRVDEYYCSSTDSVGFKVLIGNPIETPKMADYSYLTSPGTEIRYVINPEIRDASTALRSIALKNRQCYFSNERPLFYYRTYTLRNCRLECQSNYTYLKCQCIPYYLPKSTYIKTCGKADEVCSNQAKEDMELVYGNGSSCHCLPSCFELSFSKTSSFSMLSKRIYYKYDFDGVTQDYFVDNMVVMHFFFQDSRFRKTIKSELYGFTDVLANVGGLLGLCLGFSFLSFVELIYFIIIRFIGRSLTKIKCYNGKLIKLKPTGIGRNEGRIMPFVK